MPRLTRRGLFRGMLAGLAVPALSQLPAPPATAPALSLFRADARREAHFLVVRINGVARRIPLYSA